MRLKHSKFLIGFLLASIVGTLLSCATDKAPLQIENSLPQSELEYYNDSFDRMREDLWDRAGYAYNEDQIQNFKQADLHFDNGKLIIRTKTGSFSKGGLGSNFAFRGDFDVQLDCRINFLNGSSGMDQLLNILVIDKNSMIGKANVIVINLYMGEGGLQGWLKGRGFVNGRWSSSRAEMTENFNGTLRFVRKGREISSFYKKSDKSVWIKIQTIETTANDMMFAFQLRNFFAKRTTIQADRSISAEFDNFKINAAHEIIENEI